MPEVIDTKDLDSNPRPDAVEPPAPRRTAARISVGRPGTPEAGRGRNIGAKAAPPALRAVRHGSESVRTPDRSERSTAWETGLAPEDPPARATGLENQAKLLRANAHAAYACVEGGHEAALDAALAVIEVELRLLRARCDAHAEILKQVRLYGRDAESRALATRGLEACAEVLACRQLVRAGCPRGSGYRN